MVFEGVAIGAPGEAVGEVVFNTAMTGYQEILTDPSYAKQIVTFTYPHIGNTGINQEDEESTAIWAQGLVIRDKPLPRQQLAESDIPFGLPEKAECSGYRRCGYTETDSGIT